MPLTALLGLGVFAVRKAKISLINNTIEKAKKERLTMESFNPAERQVPEKYLKMLCELEQKDQIEFLELAKKFMSEDDTEDWKKFPRYIVEYASHDLLREICFIQLESPE